MVELNCYFWETLYIFWQFHSHGKNDWLLQSYGKTELDGDLIYEISYEATSSVFADTKNYYQEELEYDVFVFFDPALDAFYEVCRKYEAQFGITPDENSHRRELQNEVQSALSLPSYSYRSYLYTDLDHKGPCRIVLVTDCEFYCLHEVPGGLLDILDALKMHTRVMQKDLDAEKSKVLVLPAPTEETKEAA